MCLVTCYILSSLQVTVKGISANRKYKISGRQKSGWVHKVNFWAFLHHINYFKEKFGKLSLILPAPEFRSKDTVCLIGRVMRLSTETQITKRSEPNQT